VIGRLDSKLRVSRQAPVGCTAIHLSDHNYSSVVCLEHARLKREYPERSAAEINEVIFSAILDLMSDPAWEGVQ
jgi:hypothetical protein